MSLSYDPLGRLGFTYAVNPGFTYYQYDGDVAVREISTTALIRRHVHGPGSDEPLLTYEGADLADKRYLHADERGSIIATSNASGQVTQINAYDDYGIPQGKNAAGAVYAGGTATASFGRFGYTGQAWLPEIGLYHYKARAYSPPLGRFMQTDPIGYGDGPNLYAYVGGDPVNRVDPSGLTCVSSPNGTGLGGSNTPAQGQNCNGGGGATPAVTITTTPPTLPCPDPCITVTGAPTPPPPPPPPPGAVGVAFVSTGFSGSPAPAGFGAGTGLSASNCPARDATGMCDSSGDPKASAKKLQKEQCARIEQIDNAFGSVDDAATVAGPAAFTKSLFGKIVGRIGLLISPLKISAALGRLINRANGTPCK